MSNLLMLNHFPAGFDSTQTSLTANGTVQLFGSAVATGEPINWNSMIDGIGYNEVNFRGNGVHGQNTAQTTGFAIAAGIATVTAANNFQPGWPVTFAGNTGTLSALFNNQPAVTVLTATASAFTFATSVIGTTTTGDVGIAYSGKKVQVPEPGDGATLLSTVTALSASGNTLTVTAANTYLPGAQVQVNVATGTLGPKLATAQMPSALTGTTGTGTASGINPPQPYTVSFWSQSDSGYTYSYNQATGCLFVQVGGASASNPQANISAGAYPAGVLSDCIKYEARFAKG
jgi:hypothetical protein